MKAESRSYKGELRATPPSEGARTLSGVAAVYNVLSRDLGGWQERILPGAFADSIANVNTKAFWNHNSDLVLGSRKSGSLIVRDTASGVSFDLSPVPDWANQYMDQIDSGDVEEMSFGFIPLKTRWIVEETAGKEVVIRELVTAELLEISPVAIPAYPMTSVGLRDFFNTEDLSAIKAQIKGSAPAGDPETGSQQRKLSPAEIRRKTILV